MDEQGRDRRAGKWWIDSTAVRFNLGLFVVTIVTELVEYAKHSNTVWPGWLMELLTVVGIIGNVWIRIMPADNERLVLKNPAKDEQGGEPHEWAEGEAQEGEL